MQLKLVGATFYPSLKTIVTKSWLSKHGKGYVMTIANLMAKLVKSSVVYKMIEYFLEAK